jgi:type IV secretion system protein VirB8
MTDIPAVDYRARPVKEEELDGHYKSVLAFLAHQRKWRQDRGALGWIIAMCLLPITVALSIAIACLIPLKQLVYVALLVHPDGTVDIAQTPSSIPITYEQSVVESELETYITCREGYNFADAKHCYDVVNLMSSDYVKQAYDKWFLPTNPYTPQTIAKNGQIDIKKRSILFDRTMKKTAFITVDKTITIYGVSKVTRTLKAVISFELKETVPTAAREFDPDGLIVTSYQVTQDDGA